MTNVTRRDFLTQSALAAFGGWAVVAMPGHGGPEAGFRLTPSPLPAPETGHFPAAKLFLIGGGISNTKFREHLAAKGADGLEEADFDPTGIYHAMTQRYQLAGKKVVCITSALEDPESAREAAENLAVIFKKLGAAEVYVTDTHDRAVAGSREMADKIAQCDVLFMGGGDQKILEEIFYKTEAYNVILNRYINDPSFVIAGTSAGAMVMSQTMIYGGDMQTAPGRMRNGYGLLPFPVDTHVSRRGRHERMEACLRALPGEIGLVLGLDDGTAVEIAEGQMTMFGRQGDISMAVKRGGNVTQARYQCAGGQCIPLNEHAARRDSVLEWISRKSAPEITAKGR